MRKAALASAAAAALAWVTAQEPAAPVDFAREVRPILEASCAPCHGTLKHKAGLRLDQRAAAFAGARYGKEPVVVPGARDESELWLLAASDFEDERMPPADADVPRPTPEQIDTLGRWIDEGADWPDDGDPAVWPAKHWAYEPPSAPPVPAGAAHPVDAFLGSGGAPAADRAALLRRASLDLTGLPPSLAELDAFLADGGPDAWPRALRRLLDSPHYGEQQARWWLDLARYADSHGYEKDGDREMGRWREWVIDAFNADMPWDEFGVLQLAGDLLPGATAEQVLATGFHRNTMLNEEGGTDDEEFRVAAVHDRVATTASIWLGATLGCAQCHDHKYDPFSQKDYYRFFALFDDTVDGGKTAGPTVSVPYRRDAEETARIAAEAARLRVEAAAARPAAMPEDWEWIRGAEAPPAARREWQAAAARDPERGEVREQAADGIVQHFVEGARAPVAFAAEDRLFAWVFLDPAAPPREIMLQFHQAGSWEHRAWWGEDRIPWGGGDGGAPAHRAMGALPDAGAWTRLELSPAELGLDPAHPIDGIAFSQDGGRALWAEAGLRTRGSAALELRRRADAMEAGAPRAPATMVLRRRAEPRETRILIKGSFLNPGERVEPGLPAIFASKEHPVRDRLELARWLTGAENPLGARAAVNRAWQELFGAGLVETVEDFGTRSRPLAPEARALLDWLAVRFLDDGQSLKRLYALLMTSDWYRRADAPRLRLPAETLRDVALAASGLLRPEIGGPSVMPFQPPGVDNAPYAGDRWRTADGPDRWRRGLYTFWRRSAPYATFAAFDAPSREFACTRRDRSNTPLQALALLNDPAFWEAAEALGRRMRAEAGPDDAARLAHGFRLCTARLPDAAELAILRGLLYDERAAHGDEDRAWTLAANVLLNLDETIVKG